LRLDVGGCECVYIRVGVWVDVWEGLCVCVCVVCGCVCDEHHLDACLD
jgi:hypothetical protein